MALGESDRRELDKLQREASRSESLFANDGQTLQERLVVAGFLRVLGVPFQPAHIVKCGPEPVDVSFDDARFQVTEILDKERRRNLEIRQRSARVSSATSLKDLIEPGTVSSQPISPSELANLVADRARLKEGRYGNSCRNIDLLIYVNLRKRHVFPTHPFPDASSDLAGWRSVSLVMERFAMVFWASAAAPTFIVSRSRQPIEWTKLESVFPDIEDFDNPLSSNGSEDARD